MSHAVGCHLASFSSVGSVICFNFTACHEVDICRTLSWYCTCVEPSCDTACNPFLMNQSRHQMTVSASNWEASNRTASKKYYLGPDGTYNIRIKTQNLLRPPNFGCHPWSGSEPIADWCTVQIENQSSSVRRCITILKLLNETQELQDSMCLGRFHQ